MLQQSTLEATNKEGWTFVIGSPKWHYMVGHTSICKRWMLLGSPELEQGNDDSIDNCKMCIKALQKRRVSVDIAAK